MAGSLKGQQQLAMIRAPPTTKVRRVLKGHFGKITVRFEWLMNLI